MGKLTAEQKVREYNRGQKAASEGRSRSWSEPWAYPFESNQHYEERREAFNQGYPHELKHFISCVREDTEPVSTGEDGRAVLELMNAAYHSARIGQKVALPFRPRVSKPIDLWLGAGA